MTRWAWAAGAVALVVVGGTALAAAGPHGRGTVWSIPSPAPVAVAPAPVAVGPASAAVEPDPIGPAEEASRPVIPSTQSAAPGWVAQVASATRISPVAVRAYGTATLAIMRTQPGCHLGWTTLAGIGAVESGHGTHGGSQLADDGRTTVPIVGPELDGTDGTAAVRAGSGWSHAVGPMQFLPSTWARWESDGDGDGVADPDDLDDAALAAGRYLCAGGRDLATGDGWHAAVLSYNHDEAYAALVLSTADSYATAAGG